MNELLDKNLISFQVLICKMRGSLQTKTTDGGWYSKAGALSTNFS